MAVSKSTISPLRTPREGACPTPRIFRVPSGFPSPTTTQIFEVPISRPTIKLLLAITFVFLIKALKRDRPPTRCRRRAGVKFLHARTVGEGLGNRRWRGDGFGLANFRLGRGGSRFLNSCFGFGSPFRLRLRRR